MGNGRKAVLKASEIPSSILRSRAQILAGNSLRSFVATDLAYPETGSIDIGQVRKALAADGVAYMQVTKAFSPADFLEVATRLGNPLPELDPVARRNCILPEVLRITVTTPDKPSFYEQPFSLEPISLHTEMSLAPLIEQPRFLMFACRAVQASDISNGTLVVSQKEVISSLSKNAKTTLMRTRLADHPGAPNVLLNWTDEEGRVTLRLSFRDPLPAELQYWIEDELRGNALTALIELLDKIYVQAPVRAIRWSIGTIVVLDNYRMLHGRNQLQNPGRVLWRIRVRE